MVFLCTQHSGCRRVLGNDVGQFIGIVFQIVKDVTIAIADELEVIILNHVDFVLLGMGKGSAKGLTL